MLTPQPLRLGVIGAGFWSTFQVAAWKELEGVKVVAICDKDLQKAQRAAAFHGIPNVYNTAVELFAKEPLDVVDIITNVETHAIFTEMAAKRGMAVISQKPMGPDLATARDMLQACQRQGVKFFVHENFRWQPPIRRLKALLDEGVVGRPFKARVTFCSSFPVFDNQPFLAELDQFILTDVGSHILDLVRFLFGEAEHLYCQIQTVNPDIKGEDVANVFLRMQSGLHCYAEMSYASILEHERFPQTFVLVEGENGSLELGPDFVIKTTTRAGTRSETVPIPIYDWADPDYALIHASVLETNRNILRDLQGGPQAETTGEDNLKTTELYFGCYESAENRTVLHI